MASDRTLNRPSFRRSSHPAPTRQACAAGNGDRVKYLVPVIDMANHERLSPHSVRVAEGGEAFELVVGTDVQMGEEVRASTTRPATLTKPPNSVGTRGRLFMSMTLST